MSRSITVASTARLVMATLATISPMHAVGDSKGSDDRLSERAVNSSMRRQSLDQTVQVQIVNRLGVKP